MNYDLYRVPYMYNNQTLWNMAISWIRHSFLFFFTIYEIFVGGFNVWFSFFSLLPPPPPPQLVYVKTGKHFPQCLTNDRFRHHLYGGGMVKVSCVDFERKATCCCCCCCLYLFSCLYPLMVQARFPRHTLQLSGLSV